METPTVTVQSIAVDQLKPNAWNRTAFDPAAMQDLVASIKAGGVREPLIVRSRDNGYEIASGNRRWLAAKQVGLSTVPCLVQSLTDEQVSEMNIVTNIQREDIPPMVLAGQVKAYMTQFKKDPQEAAEKFGKSRPWVVEITGFLDLPGHVQESVKALTVGWDQLRALKSSSPGVQNQVAKELHEGTLKPHKVAKRCRQLKAGKTASPPAPLPQGEGGGTPGEATVPDPLAQLWPPLTIRATLEGMAWGVTYGPQQIPTMKGVSTLAWHFWVADKGITPKGNLKKWFLMLADAMGDTDKESQDFQKKLEMAALNAPSALEEPQSDSPPDSPQIQTTRSSPATPSEKEEPLDPEIAAMVARQAAKGRIR